MANPQAAPRWICAGACLILAACGAPEASLPDVLVARGQSMGTTYTVKVVVEQGLSRAALEGLVRERLDEVDRKMSHYRPDSELSRFNAAPVGEAFRVSAETFAVFQEARELAVLSGGALDVTVAPLVEAWGFGAATPGPTPTEEALAALRDRVGWDGILLDEASLTLTRVREGLRADLSAVAKGYAVDRVSMALLAAGEPRFMVEVGGEVRTGGVNAEGQAWKIGIEHPLDGPGGRVLRLVSLSDLAMATSGDYRNFRELDGVRFTHILDPRTGRPVSHGLSSVSVVAPRCARADGLATALLALGPEEGPALAEREGLAALFLIADGHGGFEERATPAFATLGSPAGPPK